jgi:hypothetical protein
MARRAPGKAGNSAGGIAVHRRISRISSSVTSQRELQQQQSAPGQLCHLGPTGVDRPRRHDLGLQCARCRLRGGAARVAGQRRHGELTPTGRRALWQVIDSSDDGGARGRTVLAGVASLAINSLCSDSRALLVMGAPISN